MKAANTLPFSGAGQSTAFETPSSSAPPVLPTVHGDAFRHWQAKRALASDAALLNCLEQAKECIEQMNQALSFTDEAFTHALLQPVPHNDDAG